MKDGQVTVLEFLISLTLLIWLLSKLRYLQNYLNEAQMLIDSYLNGRIQLVRCGENESSVGRVSCGAAQGSVLGLLLFVSYIDGVSSRFHIYANDLQIYHSSTVSDFQKCYDVINMDLKQIHMQIHMSGQR
jgi:hypothetical protein